MSARERLVLVVAEALLARHNARFAQGTERDHYEAPPIWMTREAEAVVAAIEAEMGLRVEALDAHMLGDGVFHPASHRLVTDWVSDDGDGE